MVLEATGGWALPEAQYQALSGLLRRRRQLIDRLTAEQTRLSAAAMGLPHGSRHLASG